MRSSLSVLVICLLPLALPAQPESLGDLKFRALGPAFTGGRISDFAVDPERPHRYFVATASGGMFRTQNGGTTFKPVFDDQGSYSLGCVTLDPKNSQIVWVGTGENNSQRSVSFGDGVYVSRDGGDHFTHVGLKDSEHIGSIVIDPDDGQTVFVAAQGPLWRAGGERGVYKTTDGGTTWRRVLEIDEHTGVNEVVMNPSNKNVLYASAYQRRRRVFTLINGGPGSAIYKSTDAGETWRKMERGLPKVDKGRIGLAVAKNNSNIVYAIVEAARGEGGFFRSDDGGENWSKRSSTMTSSPQYYNELVVDPKNDERVYLLDTYLQVSEDGGKTFQRVPNTDRHVDDHALWIDPRDSDHLLVGCDGGVYETWDRGQAWHFKPNLPLAQMYRVTVDDAVPFYNVYGGTQDNNSFFGPSRTFDRVGVTNEDWTVSVGGDGYETVVDGDDPQILYALWQYGGLVRHDRRSGEIADIKPREREGETPYRWNWDTPLIRSPHHGRRIYVLANKLFCSDDRGQSWEVLSGDLTRAVDRNQLPVMGRVFPVDAVSKNSSTSFYGNGVALCESPVLEGLLYVGTDDGLIQRRDPGSSIWTRFDAFDGRYVTDVMASRHHVDTVYASFSAHKDGDFTPYLMRSLDRGVTWSSLRGDLPDRHVVWSLEEDHVDENLLFAGTEFGVFYTLDGGQHWHKISGGIPNICARDLEIQRRENDLVVATFGRGFYVLDDYAPLRKMRKEALSQDAVLFETRRAPLYATMSRLGLNSGRGSQGASYFAAENPPFGAWFTYALKETQRSLKEAREEREDELAKANKGAPYPSFEELRKEDDTEAPEAFVTIRDPEGQLVRRVPASRKKGIHRVAWDLTRPSKDPISLTKPSAPPVWSPPPSGPFVLPGWYTATLELREETGWRRLSESITFEVYPLDRGTLRAGNRWERAAFADHAHELDRRLNVAQRATREMNDRLAHLVVALTDLEGSDRLLDQARYFKRRLQRVSRALNGDATVRSRNEPTPPSLADRISAAVASLAHVTSPPTAMAQDALAIGQRGLDDVMEILVPLSEEQLPALERAAEALGAPWTPGRPLK